MWSIIAAVIFIIILLVIILAIVGRKVLAHPTLTWNSSKLPTYLTPRNYNISLNLDADAKTFNGTEIIDVEMTYKTNLIVLHGEVEVVSAEMRIVDSFDDHTSDTKYVFADQINYDANNEYILLRFETLKKIPLYNGVTLIQLRFTFNGKIRDDNRGIFLTSFTDLNNNVEKVIATQFEPINARLAFPCFEEPNFRSNFTLRVSASTEFLTFISSSPLSTRNSKGDTTVVTFETTPRLTINTFGFFLSSFLKTSDVVNGVDVSVYVPQTKLIKAISLLADAKKLISFFTNFFQTNMPSQKLDIVSLPNFTPMNEIDGSSNYGLIIMLESDLLIDQDSTTYQTQQNLLNLAREISNQWTGNLFNVKWWNSIWIIEGMNKYFQYLAVDNLHPDWEIFKNFHEDYQSALFYDSLKLSRPLEPSEQSVVTQNNIESLFGDEIINNKGATILHMVYDRLESFEIGTFSKCLREFLHAYKCSSVTSKDLWNSFQTSSSFPVVDFVSDWTYKSGYPVINFESVTNTTLTALQEPFFIYNAKQTSQLWWVSLTFQYSTKLSSPVRIKLNHTIKSSSFPSQKDNTSYFIANPGRRGFYRVAYTPTMINNMLTVIKNGGIDKFQPEDLFCILNDMISFFRSSENNPPSATIDNFFDLSLALSTSTDSNLWESVTKIYEVLHRLLDYPTQGSLYIKFTQSMTKNVYNYVGFQPSTQESVEKKFLRFVILPFSVKYNVDGCSVAAYDLFKNLVQNTTVSYDPDTRYAIYIAGAKYGNLDDWTWIRDKYLASTSYTESRRLLLSLAHTDNEDLLSENFNLIISGKLDYADIIPFLTVLSENHINQTWLFFETNWNYFVVNFPTELESLIILFSQHFITSDQDASLKDLIRKYQFPLSDPLARNLALVESNMLFHDSYKPLIDDYLTKWDALQP